MSNHRQGRCEVMRDDLVDCYRMFGSDIVDQNQLGSRYIYSTPGGLGLIVAYIGCVGFLYPCISEESLGKSAVCHWQGLHYIVRRSHAAGVSDIVALISAHDVHFVRQERREINSVDLYDTYLNGSTVGDTAQIEQ